MKSVLKSFWCLVFTGMFVSSASADTSDVASKYVDNVVSQAMEILNSSASDAQKNKQLQSMIGKYVDIPWIGKFVMGQNWRKATPEQQKAYLNNYQDFILKSYASRFVKYKGEGYKMISSRQDADDKYSVKMAIMSDGKPINVEYRLKTTGKNDFKIYDLYVEGVSLITTQRSEFNSIIQNKGIDYLIDQLANKSASLLAATNS